MTETRGSKPELSRRELRLAALVVALVYAALLTNGGTLLFHHPPAVHLTFNSMLAHLLAGRFDVDPAVVGMEGFTRDSRTYAYWGVFPALLRLPFVVIPGWQHLDLTIPSCLAAVLVACAAKLQALQAVRARAVLPGWLVASAAAVLTFSGAQTAYLQPSLYVEVCLWANALAACFIAVALPMVLDARYDQGRLAVLAALAGLALITRVSVGLGLVIGSGLAALALLRSEGRPALRLLTPAALVLGLALAVTAGINFARWGDPLTFADYRLYNYNAHFPERILRTQKYGLFNLARLPLGLVYYFVPIWAFRSGEGFWLQSSTDRLLDAMELPPASFFLTDASLLLLGVYGLFRTRAVPLPQPSRLVLRGLALGLLVPPLLMLTAISMNYRYRLDFDPLFVLLAFIGLWRLGQSEVRLSQATLQTAVVLSIVASLVSWRLYARSPMGPAQPQMPDGVVAYYLRH